MYMTLYNNVVGSGHQHVKIHVNVFYLGFVEKKQFELSCIHTCSTNLLDLLDGPLITPPSSQPTVSGNAPTSLQNSTPISPATSQSGGSILSPQTTSDFSLLDPSPAGTQPQLLPTEAQPTLALTLFEKPIGSVRVPQEYASFPLSPGWENKVSEYTCKCVLGGERGR